MIIAAYGEQLPFSLSIEVAHGQPALLYLYSRVAIVMVEPALSIYSMLGSNLAAALVAKKSPWSSSRHCESAKKALLLLLLLLLTLRETH